MQDELDYEDERRAIIRETRQRLESLRRSGVAHLLFDPARKLEAKPSGANEPSPIHPRPARPQPKPAANPSDAAAGRTKPLESPRPRVDLPSVPLQEPANLRTEASAPSSPDPDPAPAKRTTKPAPTAAIPSLVTSSLFGEFELELPVIAPADRPEMLAADASIVAACTKCKPLADTRTQTVFGTGSPTARLMFIGEAPGADEDRTGIPFVGRAGQLLTEMITKGMGIAREDVYIANILKCRPPENRQPTGIESANCIGYLERQIAVVRPEFICLLGLTAAQTLLETTVSMGHLRGKWYRYRGIATLVTYHPAYLLRSPSFKKQAWEDLQMLMKAMGLPIPKRK